MLSCTEWGWPLASYLITSLSNSGRSWLLSRLLPMVKQHHFIFRSPGYALVSAIVLLLLALAGLLAACEAEVTPTPGTQGPPGPPPTATIAPTETPISVSGTGAAAYYQAHAALLSLTS